MGQLPTIKETTQYPREEKKGESPGAKKWATKVVPKKSRAKDWGLSKTDGGRGKKGETRGKTKKMKGAAKKQPRGG